MRSRATIAVGLLIAGLLSFSGGSAAQAAPSDVERLAGADRYSTSVAVARAYPVGVPAVYVATGASFADALGAAPAATAAGGPLLLTTPRALPDSVRAEIQRLKPQRIVVVGGTGAVSASVYSELAGLAPSIRRDAGMDRYETSRIVTQRAFGSASAAFVATGADFPDALSASAAAGAMNAPVVLLSGKSSSVDEATISLLNGLGVSSVHIAGGTGAVSSGVAAALESRGFGVDRVAGSDRYATSEAINARFFNEAQRVYFAVGTGFADALSGAALAGRNAAPLFVTPSACVPTGALTQMADWKTSTRVLLGGTGALGAGVEKKVPCADGNTFSGNGDFRVGSDIRPGIYFSKGSSSCYWERLTSFDGGFDSIIANSFGAGQNIVSIDPSDVGFSSSSCDRWYPIGAAPEFNTIPSNGVVAVTLQVAPGTYRASNPSGTCYWARLSDFSGEFDGIITNDFVTAGQPIVEILPSDVGFETSNCGAWTKIG